MKRLGRVESSTTQHSPVSLYAPLPTESPTRLHRSAVCLPPYSASSPSSSLLCFLFRCGNLIARTRMLTMTKQAIAEMKTTLRLRLYAAITVEQS